MPPDWEAIRRTTLQVIDEISRQRDGALQTGAILGEAASRLGIRHDQESEQALLTFLSELFRNGYLASGLNLSNPNLPFCHLTEQGRKSLAASSRDPANPDGYLAYLASRTTSDPITLSYVREALATFKAGCSKAVMIGVAAESLILSLREAVLTKLTSLGQTPAADLREWRVKRILDAIESVLRPKIRQMPRALGESFESNWPAFTYQIRAARNDVGHPAAIDPVTQESVHASLLIFPELARLAGELRAWVTADLR